MYERPYPTTERHFVIPPNELNLPETTLPDTPENRNNHHLYWEYRKLGRFLITKTFRDLEHNQLEMPRDIHTVLHQRFGPPELPSLEDMVEQIEMAHVLGENLKVQENRRGPYFYHKISNIALKQIYYEYNDLTERKVA